MTKKPWIWIGAFALVVGCGGKTVNQVFDYQGWEWEKDCQQNLKGLWTGLQIYSNNYDDRLPESDWGTVLFPYIKSDRAYTCPVLYEPGTTLAGYSMNTAIYGLEMPSVPDPDNLVAFYESTSMVKGHDGNPDDILTTPRHRGSIYRVMLSGYVQNMEDVP